MQIFSSFKFISELKILQFLYFLAAMLSFVGLSCYENCDFLSYSIDPIQMLSVLIALK